MNIADRGNVRRKVCDRLQGKIVQCGTLAFQSVKLRSDKCNGNSNGKWGTSKEKKHLETDNIGNCLDVGGVAECYFGCFVLKNGNIFEMNPRWQAAQSKLRCPGRRLSRGRVWLRARRGGVQSGGLEFPRASRRAA